MTERDDQAQKHRVSPTTFECAADRLARSKESILRLWLSRAQESDSVRQPLDWRSIRDLFAEFLDVLEEKLRGLKYEWELRVDSNLGRAGEIQEDRAPRLTIPRSSDFNALIKQFKILRKVVLEVLRGSGPIADAEADIISDAIPPIVWIADSRGRIIFHNEQWTKLTGLALETWRNT